MKFGRDGGGGIKLPQEYPDEIPALLAGQNEILSSGGGIITL